jgi:hypothetical protein
MIMVFVPRRAELLRYCPEDIRNKGKGAPISAVGIDAEPMARRVLARVVVDVGHQTAAGVVGHPGEVGKADVNIVNGEIDRLYLGVADQLRVEKPRDLDIFSAFDGIGDRCPGVAVAPVT